MSRGPAAVAHVARMRPRFRVSSRVYPELEKDEAPPYRSRLDKTEITSVVLRNVGQR